MDINIGDRVICFYDDVIPHVTGVVIEGKYPEYIHVQWDKGGTSYFSKDRVFLKEEDWKRCSDKIFAEIAEQDAKEEYETYLRLKEKYEN